MFIINPHQFNLKNSQTMYCSPQLPYTSRTDYTQAGPTANCICCEHHRTSMSSTSHVTHTAWLWVLPSSPPTYILG